MNGLTRQDRLSVCLTDTEEDNGKPDVECCNGGNDEGKISKDIWNDDVAFCARDDCTVM